MYAGGAFSSVSTPAGVSPGGTFARGNIVAFNATTGVVASFAPSVNGVARRGVAKLNPTTGAVDSAFNANLASGKVTELALTGGRLLAGGTLLALTGGRLLAGGTFPGKLRAVNPPPGPTPATSTWASAAG
jgi:hypothetical protein